MEQEKILADKTRELEEMRREMEQAKSALRLKEDEVCCGFFIFLI